MTHLYQLPLTIELLPDSTLDNFCWQNNEVLHTILINSLNGNPNSATYYYIWGTAGLGKSHILQACCQYFTAQGIASAYLPLAQLQQLGPEILDGLETLPFIGIDDIEYIAGDKIWEEALFHLYNKIRDNPHTLFIITSHFAPTVIDLQLADLRSRLSWGMVFQLMPLQEEAMLSVLQHHAKQRGLTLTPAVGQFLMSRCSRELPKLLKILEQLDHASLIAQRRLTIPFVKEILTL